MKKLPTASGEIEYFGLPELAGAVGADAGQLPHTVKILLENLLRRAGSRDVSESDVAALARWPEEHPGARLAFMPARVLMQDFTGVPAVVDLAALRSAVSRAGGDPTAVNPFVPVDLVIDHSVQVDRFGTRDAYQANIEWEYRRNRERYSLLNWGQQAFRDFRVVPPGMGICHQVNLEYLSRVVLARDGLAFPDTLVGTDSHTTMVNGLGVLGWGVGGIEAEAAMLGQPMFLTSPVVVGIRTTGALPVGTTATDLVLTLTQMLRKHGVVGKFLEFFGAGLSSLGVADRATISNMSPEFGATSTLFPVDANTLAYLRETGRSEAADLAERYCSEQGLFRTDADPPPRFSEVLDLDLSTVEPSLAGPKRPQDRVGLSGVWDSFRDAFLPAGTNGAPNRETGRFVAEGGNPQSSDLQAPLAGGPPEQPETGLGAEVNDGSVVISAITSCTNTSNPSVMIAAGLLAKKAVEAGLETKPWVKTSLAPGSRVVTDYLERAGLLPYLEELGFNLVGYGCTTCIGNSGPLPEDVAEAVDKRDLAVVAVLSGNRNFEGRIHSQVKASYLASPPLCVAYALAGTVHLNLDLDPIGYDETGEGIYLEELWPEPHEVEYLMNRAISSEQFEQQYSGIFEGDDNWRSMPAPEGEVFQWDPDSTYIKEPPYFAGVTAEFTPPGDIVEARALAVLGDSITTDHISPAGSIWLNSPAGRYLRSSGVEPQDFNSFGSRRGNHEVMLRGTFGNSRLKNQLAPGTEGPYTVHLPDGELATIYDAATAYAAEGVPLVVLAGKEYGSGSSRDWAAKGTALLGVRAVIAESFERIHRSNLVGMGVLPLQLAPGDSVASLGLTGREHFTVRGVGSDVRPGKTVEVLARSDDGSETSFPATVRIDAEAELDYYLNGGILQMVLRQLLSAGAAGADAETTAGPAA
ncbi:MAG TPA: aconitate hydratase AcnA [Actinomycetota bacterium]|nr:aconitate hydratase AcnA [Actinomycetota bacterium]